MTFEPVRPQKWAKYPGCALRRHRPRSASRRGYCACEGVVTFEVVDHL